MYFAHQSDPRYLETKYPQGPGAIKLAVHESYIHLISKQLSTVKKNSQMLKVASILSDCCDLVTLLSEKAPLTGQIIIQRGQRKNVLQHVSGMVSVRCC